MQAKGAIHDVKVDVFEAKGLCCVSFEIITSDDHKKMSFEKHEEAKSQCGVPCEFMLDFPFPH